MVSITQLVILEFVATIESAGKVKRLGSKIKKDWDVKKLEFMNFAIREKFKMSYLKTTIRNEELIEGNFGKIFFWGICDVGQTPGEILMEVRKELKETD
jgi:predicted NAD-dependent protein-ADP-ribosyltransferase YbiA (DUF1768 family)